MHIFFEANESLKYSARLQAALLKAYIYGESGTLPLWMRSLYLTVNRCMCVCMHWPFGHVCVKKDDHLLHWSIHSRTSVFLCCFFHHNGAETAVCSVYVHVL